MAVRTDVTTDISRVCASTAQPRAVRCNPNELEISNEGDRNQCPHSFVNRLQFD